MEWIAAATLVAVSASVSYVQWWAHNRPAYDRAKDAISSFGSLTTTAAGVMLAIAITLHYQEKAALAQADAQLKVAANEVRQIEDALVAVLYVAARNGSPISNGDPLPIPNMLNVLVTTQQFMTYADPLTIHILNSVNSSLTLASSKYLSAIYDSDEDAAHRLREYALLIARYRDALSVERCYFGGKIGSDQRQEILQGIETQRAESILTGTVQRSEAYPCLPERSDLVWKNLLGPRAS